jgi:hypothetical protein
MSRTLRASACGLALLAVVGLVRGFPRVDADPNKDYPITPQVGPWLICAAHYSGPEAPEFARQMVQWLRLRGQPAYVFNRADEKRMRENKEEEEKARAYPGYRPRRTRVEEQCVVLIGGFASPEAANAALKSVRGLPMPEVRLPSGAPAFDRIIDTEQKPDSLQVLKEKQLNPFQTAFVTHNPTIPQTPRPKFDPAWVKLNANEDYSLFKCPQPYTLVVRMYAGLSQTVSSEATSGGFLDKLWGGKKDSEMLNAAAYNAHELARALRKLHFDAYVLHTRTSSVVTVGGFASDSDPKMDTVRQQLAALHDAFVSANQKDPLELISPPPPMAVPRQ